MRKLLAAFMMAGMAVHVMAAEQVWRYVDPKTGQVTYSNVQVKGAKGDKVEIMAYPVAAPQPRAGGAPQGLGGSGPLPIPPEVLRQLQAEPRSGSLPAGLPPLPTLPGAGSASPPLPKPVAAAPSKMDGAEVSLPEPKWAKEAPPKAEVSPAWAKDPFAQK